MYLTTLGGVFVALVFACAGVGARSTPAGGDDATIERTDNAGEDRIGGKSVAEPSIEPAPSDSPEAKNSVANPTGTQQATIQSSRRGTVVLKGTGGTVPPQGANGELLKKVDTNLGKMSISAWVNIAAVQVTTVKGSKVTLEIVEEKSQMTVNGKKTNHFTPGSRVKLEWLVKDE